MLTVKHGSYLRAAFISLKAGHKARTVLTMVILRSNPASRTPHYYGQFALSMGKKALIFSLDLTHLIRTLSLAPWISLLTGFDWISVLDYDRIDVFGFHYIVAAAFIRGRCLLTVFLFQMRGLCKGDAYSSKWCIVGDVQMTSNSACIFLCTETVYLDNKSGNGTATKKKIVII